ncbi:MAG: TIGR03905 family TSCPD domain-containing protein [Clostridia bacterium]|nr:TIGR03905 family TSCPD domain-containing protein [Clostridia bacterium]
MEGGGFTEYTYRTKGVCSQFIKFDLDGDKVSDIVFVGGCPGNLKAISKLVDGWTVEKIEQYLKGNTCGNKPTSCADQLAIAVRQAFDGENNG